MSFESIFRHRDLIFLLVFITKGTNTDKILIFNFVNISNFTECFMSLKSYYLTKSLFTFLILATGCKYLTKRRL